MSHTTTAFRIFKTLLAKGQLDRSTDSDLFLDYRQPEVRTILAELEEELDFTIVEGAGTLYLVPHSDNDLLGFVTKDLREWVAKGARLADAFLLCYIIMVLLHLFYGGKNINPKHRDYVQISTLVEELNRRFGLALQKHEETSLLEEQYGLNFMRIAELWDSKKGFEEGSRKHKVQTVLNACRLLEREKLIYLVDEDKQIRTTKKLDDLMSHYYLQESRVEEIQSLFAEGGAPDAQDQSTADY